MSAGESAGPPGILGILGMLGILPEPIPEGNRGGAVSGGAGDSGGVGATESAAGAIRTPHLGQKPFPSGTSLPQFRQIGIDSGSFLSSGGCYYIFYARICELLPTCVFIGRHIGNVGRDIRIPPTFHLKNIRRYIRTPNINVHISTDTTITGSERIVRTCSPPAPLFCIRTPYLQMATQTKGAVTHSAPV